MIIHREGTFLYELDEAGRNLWSGSINANNGADPSHVEKAVRLMQAAPALLEALQTLVYRYEHDGIPNDTDVYVQNAREAIKAATEE